MKSIQSIVQTNNEQTINRLLLGVASLIAVLFLVYISFMYQVTSIAYEIKQNDKEATVYTEQVALLENTYHTKRLSLSVNTAYERGFAKIGTPRFVAVEDQTYTMAR